MTRTERLAATEDRSGMLSAADCARAVTPADARTFVTFDQVSRKVGSADTVEYWKSAPYPLSFMDGYDVKRRLRDAASNPVMAAELAPVLERGGGLLDPAPLMRTRPSTRQSRLRNRSRHLENRAWRLLWMPASLPYYETPRSDFTSLALRLFTKRLIFSSWQVVPQAVASVLSYEAERRMMLARIQRRTPAAHEDPLAPPIPAGRWPARGHEHIRAGQPKRRAGAPDRPAGAHGATLTGTPRSRQRRSSRSRRSESARSFTRSGRSATGRRR